MKLDSKRQKILDKTKYLIDELTSMQELYFDTLVSELGIKEDQEDWLFSYIFDKGVVVSFEKYLERYNKNLADIIDE